MDSGPGRPRRMVVLMDGVPCPCGRARDRVILGPAITPDLLRRYDLCPVCDSIPGRPVPWKQT